MSMEAGLKTWNKKTIGKSELEGLLHTRSEAELWQLVSNAVSAGLLSPVKSSGMSGNKAYPLYLKYRISIHEDFSEALSCIVMLHPAMTKTGYLETHPESYLRYRAQLEKLSSYLFRSQDKVPVSRKERSFEIFGEEKQLEDRAFMRELNHIGLTAEALGYYETPEYCFNDYIPERKGHMILLILENKDIWFNIRRRMYEDRACRLWNTSVDGAVYGCGNRISEAGALTEYTAFLGSGEVKYLYWGDIDRAGLNIYLSLRKNNPQLDISMFTPAYEEMIRLSEKREIPDSEDHREQMKNYEDIYKLFSGKIREQLEALIESGKRLPQEIINYETLLRVMR